MKIFSFLGRMAFVILLLCGCGASELPKPARVYEPSISFVTVEPGVRLELIDWGGTGEPLLFLAGLGNSAHVFDGFAPTFNDQYHVWGLTRRGFGKSDKPGHGYNLATLSKDILTVLDSMHMERVTLIGHSVAGEELSAFAAEYPHRVNKLIYLDAAYDRTDLSYGYDSPPAPERLMSSKDSSSAEGVQSFFAKLYRVPFELSEIQATSLFDTKGKYLGDATPDSIYRAMMGIFEHPAYNKIQAPALAFYCINDTVTQLFDYYPQLDSAQKKAAENVFRKDCAFAQQQMHLFKTQMVNGRAVEMHGAQHHLFISHPEPVRRLMLLFLATEK